MKKEKDTLPEKGHPTLTYWSSEKLREQMKRAKVGLFVEELVGYCLLFLLLLVLIGTVVMLLTFLNVDLLAIILRLTSLLRQFIAASIWIGS